MKLYERYFDFCEIYADVLYDSGKFYHAGVLFNRTSNNKSIKSFQKAGLYRECLTAAMRLSPDTINQVSLDVISDLKSVGKFKEASIVAIDYLKDYKNAVNLLVQGGHLIDAIRIVYSFNLDNK